MLRTVHQLFRFCKHALPIGSPAHHAIRLFAPWATLAIAFMFASSTAYAQSAFTLELSMAARSVSGPPGAEVLTDIQTGGLVGAAPGTRYRVEVRYRIRDNILNSVGSRGLYNTLLTISRTNSGLGTTSRAFLTANQRASAAIIDPDTSGISLPGNGATTGLVFPFRDALLQDTSSANAGPDGIGPLQSRASQDPAHLSWVPASADFGQPTAANTNSSLQRWTIYTFEFVYQSGRVDFSAEADGQTFSCFTQAGGVVSPAPNFFTSATVGQISFGIVTSACCIPSGCFLATAADCAAQSGTLIPNSSVCSPAVCPEFRLDLSLVARSISGSPGSEVLTDLQSGGVLTPTRGSRFRIELRYRIFDLAPDDVGSRGLSAALIQLTRTGSSDGPTARALLSLHQIDSSDALNPDASGISTPADGPFTGLVGPFRGALMTDAAPTNGGSNGLTLPSQPLLPLTLAAPLHRSWSTSSSVLPSADNTNANPSTWTVYAFEFVYQGGTVNFLAAPERDSQTGNRFGLFTQTGTIPDPVPRAASPATNASLTFTDGIGACCLDTGCSTTTQSDCSTLAGNFLGLGTVCGVSTCLQACCRPDATCAVLSPAACRAAQGTLTPDAACSPLLCCPLPVIQSQSSSRVFPVPDPIVLTVQASHPAPLSYRWSRNTVPLVNDARISGASAATLTIAPSIANDAAVYTCTITSSCGTSISTFPIALTACAPPVVSTSSPSLTFNAGSPAALAISATGVGTLNFQWRRAGVPLDDGGRISGARTTTLRFSSTEPLDAGQYDCLVTDSSCGSSSTSPTIQLSVLCFANFDCNANAVCDIAELVGLNDLTSAVPTAQAAFASRVELDANRLLVTEPGFPLGALPNAGRATVYSLTTATPAFVSQLLPNPSIANMRFGADAAISGEWIAIGAPGDQASAQPNSGAVYLFRFVVNVWQLVQRISAPTPTPDAGFGRAVALDANRLVVAAPGSRSVHIFRFNSINWAFEATLTDPNANPADAFASDAALDDPFIVVSSPNAGTASVFFRSPAGWQLQDTLRPRRPRSASAFPSAVAIAGDLIALSADREDVLGTPDAGAVYLFRRTDTRWSQQRRLAAPTPAVGARFGGSIALTTDALAIGEPGRTVSSVANAGAGSCFFRRGNFWFRAASIDNPRPMPGDAFATAAAIDASRVAFGAPTGTAAGAAAAGWTRIFNLLALDCNNNLRPDLCDFASGSALDANGNNIPDECDRSLCLPDFDDSGSLGIQDLFDLLNDYLNGHLTADFNDSGALSVQDIFDFLTAFFVGC